MNPLGGLCPCFRCRVERGERFGVLSGEPGPRHRGDITDKDIDYGPPHIETPQVTASVPPPPDPINPAHYKSHPSHVECITLTGHMNFCVGNAVKYLFRAGRKTPDALEDLKKARWYLEREIARLEKGTNK